MKKQPILVDSQSQTKKKKLPLIGKIFLFLGLGVLALVCALIVLLIMLDSSFGSTTLTYAESFEYPPAYVIEGEDGTVYVDIEVYNPADFDYIGISDSGFFTFKNESEAVLVETQPKAKMIANVSSSRTPNYFISDFDDEYKHLAGQIFNMNVQRLTFSDDEEAALACKLFERNGNVYGFVNVYSRDSGRLGTAYEHIVKTCLVRLVDDRLEVIKELEGIAALACNETDFVYYAQDGIYTMNIETEESELILENTWAELGGSLNTVIWDDSLFMFVFEDVADSEDKYALHYICISCNIDGSNKTELANIIY